RVGHRQRRVPVETGEPCRHETRQRDGRAPRSAREGARPEALRYRHTPIMPDRRGLTRGALCPPPRYLACVPPPGPGAPPGAALGLPALCALLIAMEAGAPIPIPSDLVILVLGERTQAGAFPLPLVALALELVAAVGTAALFFLIRGPGRALLTRFGPRIGL